MLGGLVSVAHAVAESGVVEQSTQLFVDGRAGFAGAMKQFKIEGRDCDGDDRVGADFAEDLLHDGCCAVVVQVSFGPRRVTTSNTMARGVEGLLYVSVVESLRVILAVERLRVVSVVELLVCINDLLLTSAGDRLPVLRTKMVLVEVMTEILDRLSELAGIAQVA